MDLLLDVNIVLDVCLARSPHAIGSAAALQRCTRVGGRLWLFTGSVQTLQYSLFRELQRSNAQRGTTETARQTMVRARRLLKTFARDKQWLSALAEEGAVFDSPDPEREQLIRALDRFTPGTIKLLTRDETVLEAHPQHSISPQQYRQLPGQGRSPDFIDLRSQQDTIRPRLEENIHRVLHHGQYIMGPEVRQLEERLAAFTGAKHCITVASGTEALLISLMALGIGPGHEVITTPFTFVATAEVIALCGAVPVFVDIEPDTCNIDPSRIEVAITPKTRAIIPVSLYGQVADMDEINAIAARHGHLPVIEDGAQSLGAIYRGRRSGALSTIGCTSFFPSKPLGCYGDGGAIFTSDDQLAKAMREIRVHGQDRRYHHPRLGVGGRMDTLQCAVVLAKLDRLDDEVEERVRIGARYQELLGDVPGIQRLVVRPDRSCVWAQFTVQVDDRPGVLDRLSASGIATAVHYPVPLHRQPAYETCCRVSGSLEHSETVSARVLSLPMHPYLDERTQERIVEALATAVA